MKLSSSWVEIHSSSCFWDQPTMASCLFLYGLQTRINFYIFLIVENMSQKNLFGTLKNYLKSTFVDFNPQNEVYWTQPYLLAYTLSRAAFVLPQPSWLLYRRLYGPQSSKYWQYLQTRFADPWFIPFQHLSVLNENLLTWNLRLLLVFFPL